MHVLIGLCLGVALLYFWLLGHWFARILAFLIFAALFGIVGGNLCAQIDSNISATVPSAPPPAPLPGSRFT